MFWKSKYAKFLQQNTTLKNEDRDFEEWHQGIAEYGVWVIVVDQPTWQDVCETASKKLAPFLHKHYQRQLHITIVPCGLMHPNHFSDEMLHQQLSNLTAANPKKFELFAGDMDTFPSAPYLEVVDTKKRLQQLRQLLIPEDIHDYTPHVTIGLYRDNFPTKLLAQELWKLHTPDMPALIVNEIQFCTYQTRDIKGELSIKYRFKLAAD